jgi:hypothetical protein
MLWRARPVATTQGNAAGIGGLRRMIWRWRSSLGWSYTRDRRQEPIGKTFARRFGWAEAEQHKSGQKDAEDSERSDKDELLDRQRS